MSPLGLEVIAACGLGWIIHRRFREDKQAHLRSWALSLVSAAVLLFWQPLALAVTLVLTGITWGVIRAAGGAEPARRKVMVRLGVGALLAALVGFKYAPWLLSSLSIRVGSGGWIVPLGLSFTVFRLIGAILDSQNLKTPVSGAQLLLLSLFFPTFRSGPIESLASLRPLDSGEREERRPRRALERIFFGLCRKVILADLLHALVIAPWLAKGITGLSPAQCLALPVLFGLHVYWDFSGYTDMAIGTAALMGYRVSENFNRPYLSRNLVEFWRRWHITLSEWIRTRLFMKMVGRRSPKGHMYAATVAAMALCGLWHGAGLNFLAWGLWHGLGLVAVHLFGEAQRRSDAVRRLGALPGAGLVSLVVTFVYVSLGWAVFFLPLGSAWLLLSRALLWRPGEGALPLGLGLAGLALAGWITSREWKALPALPSLARGGAMCLAGGLLLYLLLFHQMGTQEFIYAQF
jgi:D-alanyl-lipoteichoic acid acyltransferase DltB (MBOAT superfamily)